MAHILSMVALRSPATPDWSELERHFTSTWQPLCEQKPNEGNGEGAALSIPEGSVIFGLMPIPIPWGDLEWPVSTSWAWPESRDVFEAHRAHLIVVASSSTLSQVELAIWHTRAISSALQSTDASGVYVGYASLVVSPEQYVQAAESASESDLPLFVWLGFHPVQENETRSIYTTGMEQFGKLDLEVLDSALEVTELIELVANVAHYELVAGIQIGDGETVGSSEAERLRISHRKGRFGNRDTVCNIAT